MMKFANREKYAAPVCSVLSFEAKENVNDYQELDKDKSALLRPEYDPGRDIDQDDADEE